MKHLKIFQLLPLVLLASCTAKTSSIYEEISKEKEMPKVYKEVPNTALHSENCIPAASDKTLEIVTWNIEHFPKKGAKTIEATAAIIKQMDVDVIAMQEIGSKAALDELMLFLPKYKSSISERGNQNLAYIYKADEITLNEDPQTILRGRRELPRAPYVLSFHSKSTNLDLIVINNHYKAFHDTESIRRRQTASFLLRNWIDKYHAADNVLMLGDMNDQITDDESENVFLPFINDKENYRFADSELAKEANREQWSYPSYPSHIDHLLITNELFSHQQNVFTYRLRSCDKSYIYTVSDHHPVCLVLK